MSSSWELGGHLEMAKILMDSSTEMQALVQLTTSSYEQNDFITGPTYLSMAQGCSSSRSDSFAPRVVELLLASLKLGPNIAQVQPHLGQNYNTEPECSKHGWVAQHV